MENQDLLKKAEGNNFDFLRLVFAAFVIITHSYPLSGVPEYDGLGQLTRGQTSFSNIGLSGFFIISGYLILKSLQNSRTLVIYYWKRVLRLFPGLFVVLLLTTILGLFVTEYTLAEYVTDKGVWHYIPKNLSLIKPQGTLADIFKDNPYPSLINGSLWTLLYEFGLYVMISMLFVIRSSRYWMMGSVLVLFASFYMSITFFGGELRNHSFIVNLWHFANFGTLFLAGSLLAVFNIEKYRHLFPRVLILAGVALFLVLAFSVFKEFQYLILSLLIIPFGLMSTQYINGIGKKIGDLSYGIYIYGFPIQQALVFYFGFERFGLMFWSLILAIIFGYLSWHLVEKRALRLKTLTVDFPLSDLVRKI